MVFIVGVTYDLAITLELKSKGLTCVDVFWALNVLLLLSLLLYNISLKITHDVQWIYVWTLTVHILTKIWRKLSTLVKFKNRPRFSYKIFAEDYLHVLLIIVFAETIPLQYGEIFAYIISIYLNYRG